jgi:hypothetical protein
MDLRRCGRSPVRTVDEDPGLSEIFGAPVNTGDLQGIYRGLHPSGETRNWRPRAPSWPTENPADRRSLNPHSAKYNRSAMENARQLQCKALRRRQKSRRRSNNGKTMEKQWKKQCAEQWKQSEIWAHAYVRL